MNPANPFPRYRGFNLADLFLEAHDDRWSDMVLNRSGRYREAEFRWIADWGFDFVRLPLCYHRWTRDWDPFSFEEALLEPIDDAIEWAERHGLHINLCLHHAPGYCVNAPPSPEPFDLWTDRRAVDALVFQWTSLAERYHGISGDRLSFNVVNEPKKVDEAAYASIVREVAEAVHAYNPGRWIVADLVMPGGPMESLVGLPRVAQSCRGYAPGPLTHYKAWWSGQFHPAAVPEWPCYLPAKDRWMDREHLAGSFDAWARLAAAGTGAHCGEFGAYKHTPHDVVLAWMADLLSVLRERDIGWALWNFRGSFGVLDSGRADVAYEDWYGHRLDRSMLRLLQKY